MSNSSKASKQKIPQISHSLLAILGKELQREDVLYSNMLALLIKKVARCLHTSLIHPVVSNLLQEFSDLMPKELPSELPLMRAIQYNIDLQPSSTLPNLPPLHNEST